MARFATISSVSWNVEPGQTPAQAQEQATALFRQAAVAKPDLVIFPELCLHGQLPIERWAEAGELPNPVSDHFAALAREYRTNLVMPMPVVENGRCYNSAVVFDRRGEIVGCYNKAYPTPGEVDNGIAPGSGAVVHQLDIGRIGHAICFDANFLDLALQYRDLDVDLICFHSMFSGGPLLEQWALTAGAYVLSSYREESRLVDMLGVELMRMGYRYEQVNLWKLAPILTARVNFDRRLFHVDHNVADYDGTYGGVHRLLAECADKVTIEHNFPLSVMAIGALEGMTLDELITRYRLWPRNEYLRQSLGKVAALKG